NVIDLSVAGHMPTTLMKIAGIGNIDLSVSSQITRNSVNLEVALALDITGSMAGTRIADLKIAAKDLIDLVVQDSQSPTYSKVALIPYSNAVNVGSYASDVRGAIPAPKVISDAQWKSGTAKNISAATKASPA